jgi:hypothetical protein
VQSHSVVIGGTGMLARASITIARGSKLFTAVARTVASLEALASAIGETPRQRRFYLPLDWNQPDRFVGEISRHLHQFEPPSLVVAWLHDSKLGPRIASAVSKYGSHCDFFHVLGSSAASPLNDTVALRRQVHLGKDLNYHKVVLGFKRTERSSRWLTDEEISNGVLNAVSARRPLYTVGTTTPWNALP